MAFRGEAMTKKKLEKIKQGDQFGEWTVIEPYARSEKSLCRCSCGVERYVSNYTLRNGTSKSCGHAKIEHSNETKYKKTDAEFIGKTFGELTVIERANDRGRAKYRCKCSCGNETVVIGSNLSRGLQKTCGDPIHFTGEHKANFIKAGKENIEDKQVEGTNLFNLTSKPTKRSTTGVRGVYYDKKRDRYVAKINIQKKCIHLGTFKTLDEARKARARGEEKYFDPVLKKYADRFDDK